LKFSACMLVSRSGPLMRQALESIKKQEPDEIRLYLDPVKLGDKLDEVKTYLESQGAKTFIQDVSDVTDHHEDVVHAVHRALLEAENKWVAWTDDDDEILGDRRSLLERYVAPDMGIIYGDVLANRGGVTQIRRTRQIYQPRDVIQIIGSGQIYNRDAFREVHDLVDHGYWWDYKIFYWMMRAGYRVAHVPKITSLQNVNLAPGDKRERIRWTWGNTLNRLEDTALPDHVQEKHHVRLEAMLDKPFHGCVVCGCTESEPMWNKSGGSFVRCTRCGLVYVQNRDRHGYAPDSKLGREAFAKEELAPGQKLVGGDVLLREIFPYVKRGGRVLDAGCATGYHSAGLADKGYKVYGVEPNRTSAEYGATHFPIEMHIGYLETAPWPEEYFDAIITKETAEHFHRPNIELSQMRRLLKPGGLLLLKTGASQNNRDFSPEWRYCQPCEFYFFTLPLLVRLVWQNGFTIIRTQDLVDGKGEMRIWARRAV